MGREAFGAPRTASRPGRFLLGILLLPGGLVMALGLAIAWAGLVLLLPGLRRMTASSRGSVGDEIALPRKQPYGEPHEPSPPVVWIGQGGTC